MQASAAARHRGRDSCNCVAIICGIRHTHLNAASYAINSVAEEDILFTAWFIRVDTKS